MFPQMDERARDALLHQLQEDVRSFAEEQESEWAANRRELRRFLGG